MENNEHFFTITQNNGMNLMSVGLFGIEKVLNNYHIKIAYYGECGSPMCFPFKINNQIITLEDFRDRFDAERREVNYIGNNHLIFYFFDCRLKSVWNIQTKYNFILILEGDKKNE